MPPIEKMDATLGTLKKCKCVPRPGLSRTPALLQCTPSRAWLTRRLPARRRHLALSTNLINKISNLAGMDSCVPRALRTRAVAPNPRMLTRAPASTRQA